MVVLRGKLPSLFCYDFPTASHAPVDTRMRDVSAGMVGLVKSLILALGQVLRVLVDCHVTPPLLASVPRAAIISGAERFADVCKGRLFDPI